MVKGARARSRRYAGPLVDVPGLDLFVEAGNRRAAEAVLQKKMRLFPDAESEAAGRRWRRRERSGLLLARFATEDEADVFLSALKTRRDWRGRSARGSGCRRPLLERGGYLRRPSRRRWKWRSAWKPPKTPDFLDMRLSATRCLSVRCDLLGITGVCPVRIGSARRVCG